MPTHAHVRPRARRTAAGATMLAVLVLGLPAAAQAAAPGVTTGGAANIGQQSATLKGNVNPKGKPTVFWFQYGRTAAYGSSTAEASAGTANATTPVTASIVGLTPNATYHYRLFARNADGTSSDVDRTFKTDKQPLGFTLDASPNPVPFGGAVTLQGVLSGTGNAGRQVVLEQNVFPFTAGFSVVGNPQVTGATGAFSFPVLGVTTNAQYRVATTGTPKTTSSIVTLGVSVIVATKMSTTRPRRGSRVRFTGTITPAKPGTLFAVQRRDGTGTWVTVAGGTSAPRDASSSKFSARVRVRRRGDYRVFAGVADGFQVSGIGRTVTLRPR